jgi:hypothetical protein
MAPLILLKKIRSCLAQFSFIGEVDFLEMSFINNFLGKVGLFWKSCLAKQLY